MTRQRHSDEHLLKLLREIERHQAGGADVATARLTARISDGTDDTRRKRFESWVDEPAA